MTRYIKDTNYERGLDFLKAHYLEYIDLILTCMRERIKPQGHPDVDLLNHALKILATHGWEKCDDPLFAHDSICLLLTRFMIPLQDAGMNTAAMCDEWDDIVQYAKKYIDLVRNSYAHVWWKLYNCPDTLKWKNILGLVELLFTIPLSNGHLEQCFSQLKVIKSDRRSCLKEDRIKFVLKLKARPYKNGTVSQQ